MYQGIIYAFILLVVVGVGFWLYRQGENKDQNKTLKTIDKVQDEQNKIAIRNDTVDTVSDRLHSGTF